MTKDKSNLKPLIKYIGGKSREIKHFKSYFPEFTNYVEPFVGGGAVYCYLNNLSGTNTINDVNFEHINFLRHVKDQNKYLLSNLEPLTKIIDNDDKDVLKILYYKYRNLDRDPGLSKISPEQQALRHVIINSLNMRGMQSYTKKDGYFSSSYNSCKSEYNGIPFNNKVQSFCTYSKDHINLLNKTTIRNEDFDPVMKDNDLDNTFMFIDPPYTSVFKEYTHGNVFDNNEQIRLFNTFSSLKRAKAMIILNKDEFTSNLYKDYIKAEYDKKYGLCINNRNITLNEFKAVHLIITNY